MSRLPLAAAAQNKLLSKGALAASDGDASRLPAYQRHVSLAGCWATAERHGTHSDRCSCQKHSNEPLLRRFLL